MSAGAFEFWWTKYGAAIASATSQTEDVKEAWLAAHDAGRAEERKRCVALVRERAASWRLHPQTSTIQSRVEEGGYLADLLANGP